MEKTVYNVKTGEAVVNVPAHGPYQDTKYIIEARSSEVQSKVAGKWMIVTSDECNLEDVPDFIHPEDLINEHGRRNIGEANFTTKYVVDFEKREATQEEYEALTERMKSECAGKTIYVSSSVLVDEEEYLASDMITINLISHIDNHRKKRQIGLATETNCRESKVSRLSVLFGLLLSEESLTLTMEF